jgi:hypothetical protein
LLLETAAAVYDMLLDITYRQLDVEVAGVLPGDLFQAIEEEFELGQIVNLVNLPVQCLKFL